MLPPLPPPPPHVLSPLYTLPAENITAIYSVLYIGECVLSWFSLRKFPRQRLLLSAIYIYWSLFSGGFLFLLYSPPRRRRIYYSALRNGRYALYCKRERQRFFLRDCKALMSAREYIAVVARASLLGGLTRCSAVRIDAL